MDFSAKQPITYGGSISCASATNPGACLPFERDGARAMERLKTGREYATGVLLLRRYRHIALIICLDVALTVIFFYVVRGHDQDRTQAVFERQADTYVAAVQKGIERNLEVLESIGGLYAASIKVERHEFSEFAQVLLSSHSDIQALEWIPRVRDSERASYEEAARQEGFTTFQFTQRKGQGIMERAARRAEYFPVYYLEPLVGNATAAGFDLASNPARLEALEKARDAGAAVVTARITLVQETGAQYGALIYRPIYRNGAPRETVQERRENLMGFALGVFRIGDMVLESLKELLDRDIDIHLYDDSAPEGERLLLSLPAGSAGDAPVVREPVYALDEMSFHARLDVPGRRWSLRFSPTPEFLASHDTWQEWGVLGAGLTITALLVAYLLSMINRATRVEGLAAKLSEANDELASEITERKEAVEAEHLRTQDLQAAVRALQSTQQQLVQSERLAVVGQIVSGVAHELNNPLSGIWGVSEALAERDLDQTSRAEVTMIRREAERCVRIVQDLLAFARPNVEGKALTSINAAAEAVLQLLRYDLRVNNIEIDVRLQPDLPPVMADSQQIQQVVLNLIVNAEQAMVEARGRGRLLVETRRVGKVIHLLIGDDGPGIPEEALNRVFEPFFTTKEVGKGTGLGLSICYGIILEHGGTIHVESELSKGAMFTVKLPVSGKSPE